MWLPTEAQLRERLGAAFARLVRQNGRYTVVLDIDGRQVSREASHVDEAYGRALLYLATGD